MKGLLRSVLHFQVSTAAKISDISKYVQGKYTKLVVLNAIQNNWNNWIFSATNWVCDSTYELSCSYGKSLLQLNLTLFPLYKNLSMTHMSIRGDFQATFPQLGISYKIYDSE